MYSYFGGFLLDFSIKITNKICRQFDTFDGENDGIYAKIPFLTLILHGQIKLELGVFQRHRKREGVYGQHLSKTTCLEMCD